MPRHQFREIMKFIRFDLKDQRSARLVKDKFDLVSEVWDSFIENCSLCYVLGANITVDEQLFPTNARCKFTQYMANKPDKFGMKFWLAADVGTKYLSNGFPYLGKDDNRPPNQSLSEHDVMKLMAPYLGKGRNVTMDNFFTSVSLAEKLEIQSTSLVGTVNRAQREIPQPVNTIKAPLYDTVVMKNNKITLTVYQGKKNKKVLTLSTLHPNIPIGNDQSIFQKQCHFIIQPSIESISIKTLASTGFYNILDLAGINAWVLFKQITGERISGRIFLQMISVELRTASAQSRQSRPNMRCPSSQATEQESEPAAKCQHRQCQVRKCKNKTFDLCNKCHMSVCGKRVEKVLQCCSECFVDDQ
ncbi:hypothetical protein PR048_008491 [Dryococelus australis]|uniref:PiggyBac transposable element-derived protein domain-containing protein n=1 Tax=Dryococelus australis TaxID=614101 RepID=A0ABQ9HXK8_9NEOP|nr:hypothetical protein PR048_008491 [Dryococelus australis]